MILDHPSFRLTCGLLAALASVSGCGDGTDSSEPVTGVIQVAVSTIGTDPDPDGYVATLDGTGAPLSLADNGSASVNAPAGDHTVELNGLSSNCTVDAASQQVTVTAGDTATVSFAVSCTAIVMKAASFVGIIAAVPDPSTSGETFRVTVVIAGERGTRPTGGTVAVSSNLEPDVGCDAAPLTPDVNESFATCEMSLTTVGTHTLKATYSGDAEFEGNTATPVEHVVIAPAP